jgi:acyl carrier protein
MEIKIESRVKYIMSNVFGVPENEINTESSPNTIETWDSMKQIDLVISLEEEFEIELSNEQIVKVLDYKSLLEVIKEEIQL